MEIFRSPVKNVNATLQMTSCNLCDTVCTPAPGESLCPKSFPWWISNDAAGKQNGSISFVARIIAVSVNSCFLC